MAREVKELMLKELEDRFHNLGETGCVVLGYKGLSADEARQIRLDLRRGGSSMMVIKNTLFSLAVRNVGAGGVAELVDGPTAVVTAENPVDAAKLVAEIAKNFDSVEVRGAYVDGDVVGPDGVERLASIPGREQLLSMIAGALLEPLRRLAGGLLAKPRELLNCIDQLKERASE
jgi:large subunit ribosomal protein L10